jgi:hypothetical protein
MKAVELKVDLHDKIEHADPGQLKELYGLIINYFNGNNDVEEWETLPELQKRLIDKGLEQANAGLGTSLKQVNKNLRNKYGLNG